MVEVISPELPRVADLLERLGDISPRRVLLQPPPGTALRSRRKK